MNLKTFGIFFVVLFFSGVLAYLNVKSTQEKVIVTNFDECVEVGNAVMESWPERCMHDGENFTKDIGNEMEKTDLIRIDSPRPAAEISSPLQVAGSARGIWFFEANAPVTVVDWNGIILGEGYIEASGDWMTEEFVPFVGTIEFDTALIQNDYSNKGTIILKKSNPSGLLEHDDELLVPVVFK
jgi:hypothetical protein